MNKNCYEKIYVGHSWGFLPYIISIHVKLWVAINNPMCQLSATSSSKHDTRRVKTTSMKKSTQLRGLTHQWFVISSKGFWTTNSWFYTSFSDNWYTIACTFYMGTEYIPVQIKEGECKLVANLSITAKKYMGTSVSKLHVIIIIEDVDSV